MCGTGVECLSRFTAFVEGKWEVITRALLNVSVFLVWYLEVMQKLSIKQMYINVYVDSFRILYMNTLVE